MNEKYRSAPFIFLDDEKRKEWEELPESTRKNAFNILHECSRQMETKIFLELVCSLIIDMDKRIQELEKLNE